MSAPDRTYLLSIPALNERAIRRTFRAVPADSIRPVVSRLLDSLGYFTPTRDTLSETTIRVDGGKRSLIDSIGFEGAFPLRMDSLTTLSLPMPYDAGTVAELARTALEYMGEHGYPFARLSTRLEHVAPDSSNRDSPGVHVIFVTAPDQPCRFAEPLFTGSFKTSIRQLKQDILFTEGTRFDLSKVHRTRERLLKRDYITEVRTGAPRIVDLPSPAPVSGDTVASVAVPMEIRDRSGLGLDGALALEAGGEGSTKLTGFLDLSLVNILGLGDRASLSYRGERDEHKLDLSISKMHILGAPVLGEVEFGLEVREKEYGHIRGGASGLVDLVGRWQGGVALKAHETTVTDSVSRTWRFYGGDLIFTRRPELYRMGTVSRGLRLRTGTGIADRTDQRYTRLNLELAVSAHLPLFGRHAMIGAIAGKNLTTRENELAPTELFRIGGHRSVRGYAEDQFAFRNVAYAQLDYLFYFTPKGSVYIFVDGGAGTTERPNLATSSYTPMFGYGLGVRIPVRIGTATLEWARSIDDRRGLGRIHIRIRNPLSSEIGL